jgi:hypothetical protein
MRPERSHRWIAPGFVVAAVLVVVAAIASMLDAHEAPDRSATSGDPKIGLADDFLASEGVTLPQTEWASDETLAGTWECTGGEFAFEYPTGVTVFIGPSDVADPEASWKLIVDSYPEVYDLSEIHGVTALTADPTIEELWGVSSSREAISRSSSTATETSSSPSSSRSLSRWRSSKPEGLSLRRTRGRTAVPDRAWSRPGS